MLDKEDFFSLKNKSSIVDAQQFNFQEAPKHRAAISWIFNEDSLDIA